MWMNESLPSIPRPARPSWSPAIPQDTPGSKQGWSGGPHRQSCEIFSGNSRSQPEGHTRFLMAGHGVQGM